MACFQQSQGRDQTTDAEHVVEMGMGEQDAVEPTNPEPAPEQLALGPLTTVDQEPAVAVQYDESWQPSINSRHTGGRAEENDFEQATPALKGDGF